MKKKWTALQHTQKIMIIIALAVVVVAGGTLGAYAYSTHQEELERQAYEQTVIDLTTQLQEQESELAEIQKSAKALLDESYLVATVTDEDIKTLEDQLAGIQVITVEDKYTADLQEQLDNSAAKNAEVKELLETICTKFDTQTAVNALFDKPALVGSKAEKKPVITDKLDSKALKTAREKYYQKDSADKWQQSINSLLDAATAQLKQIDKVKEQLAKYLKSNAGYHSLPQKRSRKSQERNDQGTAVG